MSEFLPRLGPQIIKDMRRDLENRRGFLWTPVFFGLGSAVYFTLPAEPSLSAAVAFLLVAAVAFLRWRESGALIRAALGILLLASAGFLAGKLAVDRAAAPKLVRERSYIVTGAVEAIEDRAGRGVRLVLRVVDLQPHPRGNLPAKIRLTVRGLDRPPQPGEMVRFRARLGPPQPPLYPGGYDFSRSAYFAGIGGVGFAMGKPLSGPIKPIVSPFWSDRVMLAVERLRLTVSTRIKEVLEGDSGAIAAALIVGDRGAIAPETDDAMRIAGLNHILSISGLHMALVAACLFGGLRAVMALFAGLVLNFPVKKVAAFVALIGTVAYAFISGLGVPTERSAIMIAVALVAVLLDRRPLSLRVIAIAAGLVLMWQPDAVLDPGAQMSFAAVVALVAGFEEILRWRKPRHDAGDISLVVRGFDKALLWIGGAMLTSLIAGIATAPIALYHFDRVAPLGLPANLLATPLVSFIIMPFALITALAMPFGLERLPLWIMGLGIDGMVGIARIVADWTPAGGVMGRPLGSGILVMMAGMIWLCLWTRTASLAALPVILVGALIAGQAGQPDLIVAEDGSRAMLKNQSGQWVLLGRAKGFQSEIWLAAMGDPRETRDPSLRDNVHCDRDACILSDEANRFPQVRAALVSRAEAFSDECRWADLVISALPAPRWCHEITQVIDRDILVGSGTTTFRLKEGKPVVLDRAVARVTRPWQ